MEVTRESSRARWIGLAVTWLVTALILYLHSSAFRADLELGNHLALRGASVAATPMQRICPTMYADADMWVRHALDLAHGAGPQMRYTHADNAPYGREVHWNSGFAWLIAGSGWLRGVFTGEPLSVAIEQSMAWINFYLLLAFVIGMTTWVARRAGLGAGAFLAMAMISDSDFYAGFSPNYIDHHGLLAAAVLGLVLGAVFMGLGFWRNSADSAQLLPGGERAVRSGAIISAIFGGAGLWISAATLIPAIALVGVAGVVATLLHGRRAVANGIQYDADAWRLWGRVGAAVSFAFYLLEYAPFHIGLRLEVNHPFYALGWWAGSEIIAQIAEWRAHGRPFRWRRLAIAAAAIAITPLTIAIGGEKVFVVFDPFVTRLSQHVAEGIRLSQAVAVFGWRNYLGDFVWMGTTMFLAVLCYWRARPADRVVVAFGAVILVCFTGMELAQIRWMSSASGPQITMVIIAMAVLAARRVRWVGWSAAVLASATLCFPFAYARIAQVRGAVAQRSIDKPDAMQPIYRDIAATLRQSQPTGQIVLLASPNASVAIGYYGLFQTIGTLYWENLAGTKAAAEMFSAQTELEARRLLRQRGVTHVAMISEDNFLAEYFDLLHPKPGADDLKKSFGYQLLINLTVPLWLEQIPYEVPSDVPFRPERVILLKTHFAQPQADALYEEGLEAASRGHLDVAEAKIDAALKIDASSAEIWVAKTNLLLNRKDAPGAFAAVANAVKVADPAQKLVVCTGEASRFYAAHVHDGAAQLFRAAIGIRRDPTVLNNLAWLLATSPDDKVRNGREALALCEELTPYREQQTMLAAYAAALAECGQYPQAVSAAEHAVELAKKAADAKMVALAESRLAQYRAGRPWRE